LTILNGNVFIYHIPLKSKLIYNTFEILLEFLNAALEQVVQILLLLKPLLVPHTVFKLHWLLEQLDGKDILHP